MPRNPFLKTSLTTLGALALVGATFTGTAFATVSHGDSQHPSGQDRSVEHGRSGTQGRSSSDPDGMSNGGADKPGGSGGYDKADQDGNNGCGNDNDFEDDNNGNCGGRSHHKAHKAEAAKPAKAEHGATCTCDTTATEKAKAEKAKAEKAKAEKAKAEKAKAEAEKAKVEAEKAKVADSSSHASCDRRTDERDQRAATTEARVAKRGEVNAAEKHDHKGEVVAAPATTSTTSTTAPAGVLSSELVAPPAAAAAAPAPAPAPESFGAAAVAAPAPAGVLSSELVAPESPIEVQAASVSTGSGSGGVLGALSSALAFTGLNLVTFLLAGLLTVALGWFLVRADRKRHA